MKINTFICTLSLLLAFLFYPEKSSQLDAGLLKIYIACFVVALVSHLITNSKEGNWFRIDIVFLLGYAIVHFQWPVMYAFSGIEPDVNSRVWDYKEFINYSTWISVIGGLFFLLGYQLLRVKSNIGNENVVNYNYKRLFIFTLVLFCAFIFTAGSDFLSGAIYKGLSDSSAASGVGGYIQVLLPITILILIVMLISHNQVALKNRQYHHIHNKHYFFLVVIYVLLFLYVGDRGGAIQVVIATLVIYGHVVKPIKFKSFFLLSILGALVLTLIGIGRASGTGLHQIFIAAGSIESFSFYDFTVELANSSKTLYISVANTESDGYFYGQLWVLRILSIVPMLQSVVVTLFDLDPKYLGSAAYITYITLGENPYMGEGTSIIADIYLNFGFLGVCILTLLFGGVIKFVTEKMRATHFSEWLLIGAFIASQSLYLGRVSLLDPLRLVVWGMVIYYVLVKYKWVLKS